MKEERFSHTRKLLHGWRRCVAVWGSFRATEDSRATGLGRAKQRDSCTEDQCWSALPSPRGFSDHLPGRWDLGAEAPASDPRERTGVGCVNRA